MQNRILKRKSLRTTLGIIMLGMVIPVILITGILHVVQLYRLAEQSLEHEINQSVAAYSDLIDCQIDSYISQLSIVAKDPRLQNINYQQKGLLDLLEEYARQIGFLTIFYGDADGNTSVGSQISDRDYFQHSMLQGEPWLTSPLLSRSKNRTVLMTSVPIWDEQGQVSAILVAHLAIEEFYHILDNLQVGKSGYGFIMDKNGQLVAHPDTDKVEARANLLEYGLEEEQIPSTVVQQVLESFDSSIQKTTLYTWNNQEYYVVYTQIQGAPEDWILGIAVAPGEFTGSIQRAVWISVTLAGIFLLLSIAAAVLMSRSIAGTIDEMAHTAEQLANGDISVELDGEYPYELGRLAQSMQKMADAVREQSNILHKVAGGDYTVPVSPRSDADVMSHSFLKLIGEGNKIMATIREASAQVAASSVQLSHAAQTLSNSASEQAVSTEEFSTSLAQTRQQTLQNQQSAQKVQDAILETYQQFTLSMAAMEKVLQSMVSIRRNAQDTARIISLIENIAFQTRILALNASVEAARAGVHGHGFVVVANEVRNLAGKSSEAARETAELISGSLQWVEEGSGYVDETSGYLEKTAQYAKQCVQLTQEIVDVSAAQTETFEEIAQSAGQIAQINSSNASTAEETASAAKELELQAEELSNLVKLFRLKQSDVLIQAVPQPEPATGHQEMFSLSSGKY